MGKYSQQSIEQLGISQLNRNLWDIEKYISCYFSENDKTPLLDGKILTYTSEKHSNATLDKSIPVQIKSTMNKNVKKYHKFYQLTRENLSGIAKLGGALLFVVWINDENISEVFYQNLTPIYIHKLLSKTNAKKPAIPLTSFPNSPKRKLNVLRQVAFDLTAITTSETFKLKNVKPDKIILPTFMLEPNDFKATMKNLANQYLTIYGDYGGGNLQPLALVNNNDIELIKTELDNNVVEFGDLGKYPIRRFSKQKKDNSSPIVSFVTGAGHKLVITVHHVEPQKNRIIMQVIHSKNGIDQLINIKIMKYLATNGQIILNGKQIDLSEYIHPLSKSKLNEVNEWINSLTIINRVSKQVNIDFYNDYSNEQLMNEFNSILSFINDRENLSSREVVPAAFKYGSSLVGIVKAKKAYWNFFDADLQNNIGVLGASESDKNQFCEINPYLIGEQLGHSITEYIGNDFNLIFQWFMSHKDKLKNAVLIRQANTFCEDILTNYAGTSEKKHQLLDKISDLQDLMGHYDNNILFLNHMLVQNQLGKKFNSRDYKRLNDFTKSENKAEQVYAYYLLNIEISNDLLNSLGQEDLDWLEHLHIVDSNSNKD